MCVLVHNSEIFYLATLYLNALKKYRKATVFAGSQIGHVSNSVPA
eukprot:COSAG01_NODE_58342_length_306_cov_1.739130_1_plen_44_part_01